MPAAAAIRDFLLPYAGCSSVERLPTLTATRMLGDLNAALQMLFAGERRDWRSAVVRAPTSVQVDAVTHGSTAVTFNAFESWMRGCTVRISGDPRDNRFKADGSLENPFMGPSGSAVSATVYGDCITESIEVAKIFEPVTLDRRWEVSLVPVSTIDQYLLGRDTKPMQRPRLAALEDSLKASAEPQVRIVFDSLPQEEAVLRYRAMMRAPVVTSWADTRDWLLPNGLDASVLRPTVLMLFSTHPDFTGDAGQVQVAAKIAADMWLKNDSIGLERRKISVLD